MCTDDSSCRSNVRPARKFLTFLSIMVFCLLTMGVGKPGRCSICESKKA